MTHDVFISYSSKDKAIAEAACARLEAKGLRCWIAPRNIVPGADYGEAIINGITGSRAFALVLSANSNSSQQVVREVERAVHFNRPIVTMRIEDIELSKSLAFFLATPHRFDAFTRPIDKYLDYLADSLRSTLDGLPPPAPPKATELPAFLRDRRVLIGGGAALVAVAGLSTWFSISSAKPPTFVGKWTAEKITLSAGTYQTNGIGFATDMFVAASLQGNTVTGSFEVNALGEYHYVSAAEDSGAVSATKDEITFTSDTTHEAKTVGYYRISAMMAQAMVNANGGAQGDEGLLLNAPPLQQAGLSGKPLYASGTPLQRLVGEWGFKSQVNGFIMTPRVSLTISEDGRYRFRGVLDERGLWTAGDGKWSRTAQGAREAVIGTYAFDGGDRVTCASANGTTTWVRD